MTEQQALSAFALSDGVVYQTYSAYARGVEIMMGFYPLLDRAPRGRNESDSEEFWIRRHDEYYVVPARTLLAHHLIDEMRLMIDPIVVGRGKPVAAGTDHGHLQISDTAPSRRPAPGHIDRWHHSEQWEKSKGERTPTRLMRGCLPAGDHDVSRSDQVALRP